MVSFAQVACSIATFVGLSLTGPVAAAEPEACPGLIASRDALFARAALRQDEVGLTFIGHATFLLETPQGVRIATDYNDATRPPVTPDVVTMNTAHATHFSSRPDPAIKHVLRGWNPAGGPASHDLTVRDVRIRNVSTNIRSSGGATEYDGNSIFVFETAQLCIAHLGHLHHTLSPEHLKQLGRIDVLLGAGRRQLHAGDVRHDGGAALHQCAADDPDALLRSVDAQPVSWLGPGALSGRVQQYSNHHPLSRRTAEEPEGPGAARDIEWRPSP